ncbi:MAG: MFS transporter [Nitrososphaeria archaeon]
MVLPTLIIAISSIDPPALIVSISLIEVALAFGVSVSLAGQIRSIGSILAIIAALAMGVMSVRYDYKTLLLGGLLINLVTALCCTFAPSFALLFICFAVMSLAAGIILTCMSTLLLGQVPRYRGTVMSVNSAATQLGVALGALFGGLILYFYSWGMMGVVFGAMHIIASIVYELGAKDSYLSAQGSPSAQE